MKDIAIYGAGGLGREVACLVNAINKVTPQWNLIGFFDDGNESGRIISHFGKVLGDWKKLNEWHSDLCVAICVGSPSIVKRIIERIDNPRISFPNLIHPNVRIADEETFKLGIGNIIKHDCGFSCDDIIGNFNLLNGGVVLGHDVKIGNFNTFMPDVRISGDTSIGNGNFFGVRSIVLQGQNIGNEIRLGTGSVLMTKPKDGELYIGNPAKRYKF